MDESEFVQLKREDLEVLRRKAQEADELKPRLEEMSREVAFSRAGIDLSDRHMSYFVRGYQGDLSPEAIRAAAEADGFLKAKGTPAPPKAELRANELLVSASESEVPSHESFADMMRNAKSVEEVMAAAAKAGLPTTWNRHDL